MKRYFFLLNFVALLACPLMAGSGEYAYRFLELPFSAHEAALGGSNSALAMDGVNGAMSNPSLLSEETDNELGLNFTSYLADTKVGSIAYGKNWKKNMFAVNIQYVNYGTFDGKDEYDQSTGTFSAKDFAFSLMYAKPLSAHWQAGLALKPIYSAYESYTSFGLGVDLGISYVDKENNMSAGLALTNIGQQITSYTNETAQLPFNSILSFSKKFDHAPIRVFATAHHLHEWNLKYTNTITTSTLDGNTENEQISFIDMLFRHTIFGVELVPNKHIYITASYNHQRARELRLDGVRTAAGFSFGGGLKISKFDIGFGASEYQSGVWTYQFSLSTGLNSFKL